MRIDEFTAQFKEKTGRYQDWSDTEIIQLVKEKKPELLQKVDQYQLAEKLNNLRQQKISEARQKQFRESGIGNRFASGAGQGALDFFMGIQQLFTKGSAPAKNMYGLDVPAMGPATTANRQYEENKQAYMDASKGDKVAGAGEITGAIGVTAPIPGMTGAKLASKIARPLYKGAIGAGTALATGAGYGATEHVDKGETRLRNTLMGTLFGGGGYGAGKLVKHLGAKTVNAWKNKMKDAPTQELMDLAKKYKVDPSLGDITQSPTLKKAEIHAENVPGLGMAGFREKGAKKVTKSAGDFLEKSKQGMGDDWTRIIQKSGNKQAREVRGQATKLYNKVDELSAGTSIKPKNALEEASKFEKEISESVLGNETNVFTKIKTNLSKDMTFKDLRKARSDLAKEASRVAPTDPNLARQINEVKSGVEYDIERLVGKQAEVGSIPKKNMIGKGKIDDRKLVDTQTGDLKEAFHKAQKYYKDKVVPFKDKTLAKALKTDEPDQIYGKFVQRGKGDRAQKFYNALDSKGQQAVRHGMIADAYEKALNKDGSFSPARFTTRLKALKEAKGVFFKGEKKSEIDGLENLMTHLERFGQYAENPPTGNRVSQILGIASYATVGAPLAAATIRALSSKPVKRFLLASSKLDPKSEKMKQLIKRQLSKQSAVIGKTVTEE